MRIKRFGVCIAALCAVAAVSAATETGDKEPFWLGGDISGMNATRLRVWVNPKDGFCSSEDVVKMAKRSQALGMPVMIDFHYSDWWADPGKQNPPKAWLGMTLEQTEKALADHTRQTLRLLKDIGISVYPYWTPEWNAEDDYRLGAFSRNMPTVIMDAFKEAASSAR